MLCVLCVVPFTSTWERSTQFRNTLLSMRKIDTYTHLILSVPIHFPWWEEGKLISWNRLHTKLLTDSAVWESKQINQSSSLRLSSPREIGQPSSWTRENVSDVSTHIACTSATGTCTKECQITARSTRSPAKEPPLLTTETSSLCLLQTEVHEFIFTLCCKVCHTGLIGGVLAALIQV